jgi:hypothetical protein
MFLMAVQAGGQVADDRNCYRSGHQPSNAIAKCFHDPADQGAISGPGDYCDVVDLVTD